MAKVIDKIVTKLILGQPYFAVIAMNVPAKQDTDIDTLSTNGKVINYNPNFLNMFSNFDHKVFFFAHEYMHIALKHHLRMGDRDFELWNIACDYEVNLLLKDAEFRLPDNVLIDESYRGMTAEQIYSLLKDVNNDGFDTQTESGNKESNNKKQIVDGNGNPIDNQKWNYGKIEKYEGTKQQKQQEGFRVDEVNQQAIRTAQKAGNMPFGVLRVVEELLKEKINYRAVMQRFFDERIMRKYDWNRPNKRYVHRGIYLPRRGKRELGNGVVFVDTSGSINKQLLQTEISEIFGILNFFDIKIYVVCVDSDVQSINIVDRTSDLSELTIKGGGGTNYIPAFDWLSKQNDKIDWVLYYTDGWCTSFPNELPEIPVLWVLTYDNLYFKPPFGEVISMQH